MWEVGDMFTIGKGATVYTVEGVYEEGHLMATYKPSDGHGIANRSITPVDLPRLNRI